MFEDEVFPTVSRAELTDQSLVEETFDRSTGGWSEFADISTAYGPSLLENNNPSYLDITPDIFHQVAESTSTALPPKFLQFLLSFTTSTGLETTFNFEPKTTTHLSTSHPKSRNEMQDHTSQYADGEWSWDYFDFNLGMESIPVESDLANFAVLTSPIHQTEKALDMEHEPTLGPQTSFGNSSKDQSFCVNKDDNLESGEVSSLSKSLRMVEWLSDPLFAKTKEIWDEIREAAAKRLGSAQEKMDLTPEASGRCLEFFCPAKIQEHLETFWDRWYPNCPIIHKPTFEVLRMPSSLLAVMVLIGASMSPNLHDREAAKEWLDIAEELSFRNELLSKESVDSLRDDQASNEHKHVRTLQGAFLACVLQNWEGTDEAKTRIRRRRYGVLIAVSSKDITIKQHNPAKR